MNKHADKSKLISMMAFNVTIIAAVIAAGIFAILPQSVYAQQEVINLESSAVRDGNFISVNKEFQTDTGKELTLFMTGLKAADGDNSGNVETFIRCLEENYHILEEGNSLKIIDDAFCDAEKWDLYDDGFGYDNGRCWAASISNMLWLSGWTEYLDEAEEGAPEFSSEDEIFAVFEDRFTSKGADTDRGIDWFFMGEFFASGMGHTANVIVPQAQDGYLKSFVSSQAQKQYDLIGDPSEIGVITKVGPVQPGEGSGQSVFECSIGRMVENEFLGSEHAVTLAGLIIDPHENDEAEKYKAVIIIDSDNDAIPDENELAQVRSADEESQQEVRKRLTQERPNSYTVYPIEYVVDVNGTAGWVLKDDGEDPSVEYPWAICNIDELPFPSDDLIESCRETQGSLDHMNDIDLTLDNMFLMSQDSGYTDPYYGVDKEIIKTEFASGEPVRLNYFVADRSCAGLNEYAPGKELILSWQVTKDSDGQVIASGSHICQLPVIEHIEGGSEKPNMITLNEKDGNIESWEPGAYTLTAEINKDHLTPEAYYMNNLPKQLHFSIN